MKSHYIPRFVLRAFADDHDRIWFTKTDREWEEPRRMKIDKVFCQKDLYTVIDENGNSSDLNERMLAKKETQWACALDRIEKLLAEEHEDLIEEEDARLGLEYYLRAGCRTPEHLDQVMHGGEHKPRELICKVFGQGKNLSEADYCDLEKNIRATLGSGRAELVERSIEVLKRIRGLGIYQLNPGTEHFIIGSMGVVPVQLEEELMYFLPVAPDMALFCTNRAESLVVTRQGKEGDETRKKMNVSMWNESRWVAAASPNLLKAVQRNHLCF